MTVIHVNLSAAADAQTRLDEGVAREGDEQLAADLEGFHQQEWDRFWEQRVAEEDAAWLAFQCRHCGPQGSSGPDCGDCPEGDPALTGNAGGVS